MKAFLIFLCLSITWAVQAQEETQDTLAKTPRHKFGFQASLAQYDQTGSGTVGDIAFYFQLNTDKNLHLGIFYNYQLSDRFALQTEAIFNALGGFSHISFNQADNCGFCPLLVPNGTYTPVISTPISALIKLPVIPQLELIGGLTPHLTLGRSDPTTKYPPEIEAEVTVNNSVSDAIKSVYVFYSIGAKLSIGKRIALTARYNDLLSDGFMNPLKVGGKSYRISNHMRYVNLNLSYNFYSFKLPKFRKKKRGK